MKPTSLILVAACLLLCGCGQKSPESTDPARKGNVGTLVGWSLRDALYGASASTENATRIEVPSQPGVHCWLLVTPTMVRKQVLVDAGLSTEDMETLIGKAQSVFEQAVMGRVGVDGRLGEIELVPKNLIIDSGTQRVNPGQVLLVRRLDDREVFELIVEP